MHPAEASDVVWFVLGDGPCAGFAGEAHLNETALNITCDGTHHYRRVGWGTTPQSHRIAIFKYVRTLVP